MMIGYLAEEPFGARVYEVYIKLRMTCDYSVSIINQ